MIARKKEPCFEFSLTDASGKGIRPKDVYLSRCVGCLDSVATDDL